MVALRAQHADHCISNGRVTDMPNMGSFVAIDIRMLDNNFCSCTHIVLAKIRSRFQNALDNFPPYLRMAQAKIDIAGFGDRYFFNSRNMHGAELGSQCFGNYKRRATQFVLPRPWHNRHRIVAKTGLRGEAQVNRQLFDIEIYMFLCKISSRCLLNKSGEIFIKIFRLSFSSFLLLTGY